ncbi:hypothetical protein J6590_047341 [Homalodisca vitripennis]|nr:hypothetical protein J6590_047341 [Homalodisca vitripennis]
MYEESILPVPDCEVIRKLYGIPLEEQPVDVKVEVIKEDKFTVDYNVEEIVIDNSGTYTTPHTFLYKKFKKLLNTLRTRW